jgi:transcriptional regulator NrdR family protein
MLCPKCGTKTRVTKTCKDFSDHIRRYRRCHACDHNFSTSQAFEIINEENKNRHYQVFGKADIRRMRDLYFDEGKSTKEVAEIFGCSISWTNKIMSGKAWISA